MTAIASVRVGLIYWWRHKKWPSLRHPHRFTEWVQWRKLHDRNTCRARLTDKAYSKQLVAETIGQTFVIPTLWQGTSLPAKPIWPMPFIVKANHGCGQFVVVRNASDYRRAQKNAPAWLKRGYGGWLDEWHYRSARRLLLVEPFVGVGKVLPLDYKVYVFGGRAAMIQVHEGRGARHRWCQFDCEWRALSANLSEVTAPASLQAMLNAAALLGRGHDFLRVDFFDVDGRAKFAEFCLYPGSGLDPFDPPELDEWLGAKWCEQVVQRQVANTERGMPARTPATA